MPSTINFFRQAASPNKQANPESPAKSKSKKKSNYGGSQYSQPVTEDVDDEELDRMLEKAVSQQSKINRSIMSAKSKRSNRNAKRPLTFAEMREKERIAEASKIAPGAYGNDIIEFGKNLNNITIGGKYKDKRNDNPPVGAYNHTSADTWTKTKIRAAKINPG